MNTLLHRNHISWSPNRKFFLILLYPNKATQKLNTKGVNFFLLKLGKNTETSFEFCEMNCFWFSSLWDELLLHALNHRFQLILFYPMPLKLQLYCHKHYSPITFQTCPKLYAWGEKNTTWPENSTRLFFFYLILHLQTWVAIWSCSPCSQA